jgi:hypothetical protein
MPPYFARCAFRCLMGRFLWSLTVDVASPACFELSILYWPWDVQYCTPYFVLYSSGHRTPSSGCGDLASVSMRGVQVLAASLSMVAQLHLWERRYLQDRVAFALCQRRPFYVCTVTCPRPRLLLRAGSDVALHSRLTSFSIMDISGGAVLQAS